MTLNVTNPYINNFHSILFYFCVKQKNYKIKLHCLIGSLIKSVKFFVRLQVFQRCLIVGPYNYMLIYDFAIFNFGVVKKTAYLI